MLDLQRYPENVDLIKNVEDTVVFLARKVFIFLTFSINASYRDCKGKMGLRNLGLLLLLFEFNNFSF